MECMPIAGCHWIALCSMMGSELLSRLGPIGATTIIDRYDPLRCVPEHLYRCLSLVSLFPLISGCCLWWWLLCLLSLVLLLRRRQWLLCCQRRIPPRCPGNLCLLLVLFRIVAGVVVPVCVLLGGAPRALPVGRPWTFWERIHREPHWQWGTNGVHFPYSDMAGAMRCRKAAAPGRCSHHR